MTLPPASTPSAAIAAFLRGVRPRARLLARVQAGAAGPAGQALAVVDSVFAADAGQWPIAQWPQQYWRLLMTTPHLRAPAAAQPGVPLPGIARLQPAARAAVLLQLVAGLDDATAAIALGVPVSRYQDAIRDSLPRDALGQPDLDVWRAWHAAAQRELASPVPVDAAMPGPVSPGPAQSQARAAAIPPPAAAQVAHPLVRWLWAGVGVCVVAFAITFFMHPAGRAALERWTAPIKVEPLPATASPKARFDAGDAALHPDRALAAAPEEAGYARNLALLAWLAVASEDPRAADAIHLPVLAPPLAPARLDPPRDAAATALRLRQWDGLPARARAQRRGQWQAWQALSAGERVQLRALARRWRAVDRQEQQALRARFDAQPADARTGWQLGPRLGRDWQRINALFAFVDAGEREAVLAVLRSASADDLDALARLAQSTPPEARSQLRAGLLAQPAGQRSAWLQQQLQR